MTNDTLTTDPHRPAPVDVVHHTHLNGVFAPQREEVDVADLHVVGEIPADLKGSYLRNGPNPRFDPIGSFVFPLDATGWSTGSASPTAERRTPIGSFGRRWSSSKSNGERRSGPA